MNRLTKKADKCVFLGGTCNESNWRDEIIPQLKINFFDPRVPDWTLECMKEELKQRKECNYVLYVITPKMTGVYSIAEVVDDSNKQPDKTIFCYLTEDKDENNNVVKFTDGQIKSLEQVAAMVKNNGGTICKNLNEVVNYLNGTH